MRLLEVITKQFEIELLKLIETQPKTDVVFVGDDNDRFWCNVNIFAENIFDIDLFHIYLIPMAQSLARMIPKANNLYTKSKEGFSTDKVTGTISYNQMKNVYCFTFETYYNSKS